MLSDKRRAEAMLICITVVWGLTFALVKESLNTVQPFVFMAWRFWIAALVMAAISIPKLRRIDLRIVRDGFLLGMLLYASYSFQTFGLKKTTAGNAGFITGLFIVFTPLLAAIFLRHRPDAKSVAAVLVAVIGLGVLSLQPGLGIRVGDALVLACAFLYSVHIILLDGYVKKYDLVLLTFVQMLILALAFTASGFHLREHGRTEDWLRVDDTADLRGAGLVGGVLRAGVCPAHTHPGAHLDGAHHGAGVLGVLRDTDTR